MSILGDLTRYAGILRKIEALAKKVKQAKVGDHIPVPETVIELEGKRIRFAAHEGIVEA